MPPSMTSSAIRKAVQNPQDDPGNIKAHFDWAYQRLDWLQDEVLADKPTAAQWQAWVWANGESSSSKDKFITLYTQLCKAPAAQPAREEPEWLREARERHERLQAEYGDDVELEDL